MTVRVLLNGRAVDPAATTLAELLAEAGHDPAAPIACAVNRRFVPRSAWSTHTLADGDAVDVVTPVTGG